jgi:hypothetical protein
MRALANEWLCVGLARFGDAGWAGFCNDKLADGLLPCLTSRCPSDGCMQLVGEDTFRMFLDRQRVAQLDKLEVCCRVCVCRWYARPRCPSPPPLLPAQVMAIYQLCEPASARPWHARLPLTLLCEPGHVLRGEHNKVRPVPPVRLLFLCRGLLQEALRRLPLWVRWTALGCSHHVVRCLLCSLAGQLLNTSDLVACA